MGASIEQLKQLIERIAPPEYAADWDNCGMNVDLRQPDISGVLVCLDVTPKTIREAVEKGCGLIVSHHPLLFRPAKSIDTGGHTGACVAALIQNDISLYCAHTSMDAAPGGVNDELADVFGLENRRCLADPHYETFYKIGVTVPRGEDARRVKDALADAGAGRLGNYSRCNFAADGVGEFLPEDGAEPYLGAAGTLETAEETLVMALVSAEKLDGALAAIRAAHPYEEPAIDVFVLKNTRPAAGMGIVGDLPKAMKASEALDALKNGLPVDVVRFHGDLNGVVSRIAVCGGSGGELAALAAKAGAQLFVTGEAKHNQYVESPVMLAEAGHFDTEKRFCGAMARSLQKAIDSVEYNVAVCISEHMERPYVNY